MKAWLERHTMLIQWLSGLGFPIAFVLLGWIVSRGIESARLECEYVRMALGVLAKEPKATETTNSELPADELALRMWAVRLLNRKAPEPFTASEQKALLDSSEPFGDYIGPTYNYTSPTSWYDRDGRRIKTTGEGKSEKIPGRWDKKPPLSPAPTQMPK